MTLLVLPAGASSSAASKLYARHKLARDAAHIPAPRLRSSSRKCRLIAGGIQRFPEAKGRFTLDDCKGRLITMLDRTVEIIDATPAGVTFTVRYTPAAVTFTAQ